MPSERIAEQLRGSLAEGENYEDFAYLFDALMLLRRPYHQDSETSENVAGKILCILFPDKPARYVTVIQQFRLGFAGVPNNARLQAEFWNCVRNAAIAVGRPEDIVW
ncbi:MAG TPA: hypothetical protein VNJ09_07445, partial [Chthonomonadales bacterium]|nr:hypothetical protein [Chthonomonadales bacterium]